MHACEMILYVADQARSREFYCAVLAAEPTLDVPGMTELDLGGATLGLMPAADMPELIPGVVPGRGQRCELYLRIDDAAAMLARAAAAGGTLLAPLAARAWGEMVGYALDQTATCSRSPRASTSAAGGPSWPASPGCPRGPSRR